MCQFASGLCVASKGVPGAGVEAEDVLVVVAAAADPRSTMVPRVGVVFEGQVKESHQEVLKG